MWFKLLAEDEKQKTVGRLVQADSQKDIDVKCREWKINLIQATSLSGSKNISFDYSQKLFSFRNYFEETIIDLKERKISRYKISIGKWRFFKSEQLWQAAVCLVVKQSNQLNPYDSQGRIIRDAAGNCDGLIKPNRSLIKAFTLCLKDISSETIEMIVFKTEKYIVDISSKKDFWGIAKEDRGAIEWMGEIMNLQVVWDQTQ